MVAIVGGGASPAELGVALETLIRHVLAILGWFTVLAAVLDRWLTRSRVLENWNPIDLRSSPPARLATREAARAWEQVRYGLEHAASPFRVASIPQFIVCVVVSAWWLVGLKFPFLILGHAAHIVDWAPVVDTLFPFLVAFQLLVLANQFVRVTRHHDTRFLRFMRIVWANAGWVFILLLLIADHKWVVWTGTPEQWKQFQALVRIGSRQLSIVDIVNYSISFALAIAAIAYLADTVRGWRRSGRRRAVEQVLENKLSR